MYKLRVVEECVCGWTLLLSAWYVSW